MERKVEKTNLNFNYNYNPSYNANFIYFSKNQQKNRQNGKTFDQILQEMKKNF